MRFWILCAVLLASSTSPGLRAQEGVGPVQRVLVVNLVEPELTQSHLGLTAFSTSERKIDNDWAMGVYAMESLATLLAAAGYESLPASTEGRPDKVLKNPMATWSAKPAFQKDFASWLKAAMEETDAAHAGGPDLRQTWNPGTYAEFSVTESARPWVIHRARPGSMQTSAPSSSPHPARSRLRPRTIGTPTAVSRSTGIAPDGTFQGLDSR